jgi:hypothetical protein
MRSEAKLLERQASRLGVVEVGGVNSCRWGASEFSFGAFRFHNQVLILSTMGSLFMPRILLLSLIAAIMLAACNPIKSDRQSMALQKTLWAYEQTIRWDELYKAWSFQEDEVRKENPVPDNLAGIKITGYDQIESPLVIEEGVAQVVVRIQYIRVSRQVLREIIDKQIWRYDDELNTWRRANPIPAF